MGSVMVQEATNRGDRTRIELLRSAERLLGREGFNAPSLRRIAEEAGQQNPSVVHYHFDNRDGLLAAIFEWRTQQMEPVRTKMLQRLETQEKLHDVGALLAVMMEPHLSLRDEDGGYPFAEFLLEYVIRFPGEQVSIHPVNREPTAVAALSRARNLILERMSFLPEDIRNLRIRGAIAMILHSLIVSSHQQSDTREIKGYMTDAINMAAMALLAPPAPE